MKEFHRMKKNILQLYIQQRINIQNTWKTPMNKWPNKQTNKNPFTNGPGI